MDDAIRFKNEAELDSYLEQVISQLRMPSESIISQLVTSCFDIIEQCLPKPEILAKNLSLKQVALLYIYNQEIIGSSNANAVATKYGHNSGVKLRSNYSLLSKRENRVLVGGQQAAKMLENIAAIKPLLKEEALAWAERDEKQLKKY